MSRETSAILEFVSMTKQAQGQAEVSEDSIHPVANFNFDFEGAILFDCLSIVGEGKTKLSECYFQGMLNGCSERIGDIYMSRISQVRVKRNYENCSGCRRCEIACSLSHEGKTWPEASRVRVFMSVPGVEIPHLCFQCEDYPCVEACPVEALSVNNRTGAVNVDISKCTACGQCIEACPGNVPHMHPTEDHIVICDLCGGKPRCAEACQEGRWNALKTVPRDTKVSYKALAKTPDELTREVAKQVLGEEIAKEVLEQ